jgi:flagellar L-ring protein precursor FlgH
MKFRCDFGGLSRAVTGEPQRVISRWGPLLWAAVAAVAAPTGAKAGSIWDRTARRGQALYTDDTARRVGDVLTIVLLERSVIENATTRDLSRKSTRKVDVSSNIDLLETIDKLTWRMFHLPKMKLDISGDTKFTGEADYDSDRKVEDKFTVTVQDVMPNGNLVVVGSREREVAGDRQVIQVSGVIRPSDITFANTVRSDQVADFRVVYKNRGLENRFTKPAWLDWILNWVAPF